MEDQAAVHRIYQELGALSNSVQPSEERARAQAKYEAVKKQHRDEGDPERERALCKEMTRCLDHLEHVEKQEKVEEEQRKTRQQELEKQLIPLLSKRYGGFTPSVQQRSEQSDEDATLPTPSSTTRGINTGLDNNKTMNTATDSPIDFENTVRGRGQSAEPPEDIAQAPGIRDTTEPRSTTERTHSRATTIDQQDSVEQTGRTDPGPSSDHSTAIDPQRTVQQTGETSSSNKRRGADTTASRRTKHQRQAIETGSLTKNTILFGEVYGDGQVDRRCRIIERDGRYYIFKCKKHDRLFDAKDPLQSATIHLKSHGKLRSTHENAFKNFGYQVIGCTEEQIVLNNRLVDRYLGEQEHKKERRKASTYNLRRYPRTGDTYMAWWNCDGVIVLHALLVIPFSESEPRYGVDVCVENSELGDDIPACYESDGTWAEGYKDGQRHMKNRIYPIMCFDGNDPHLVDWLPVAQFRKLDVHDPHLDYAQDVRDYLASTSNNGDSNDNSVGDGPTFSGHTQTHIEERPESVEPVRGYRTLPATGIPESHPQRDVKVESLTRPSERQQLWPLARRAPPAMESLDNSDSE
ncbi:hypothetical protein NW752_010901 [Fusarium irregulare]|uniref:Uncharacterized protein n=1 Tax=Fusarium irregulare TaxID=2494466 RepID=A0A9W8PEE6_9HYPO|nr:hypothetical protein NW766_011873 [Fusarium irregulare]KAJ4006253.1 hypothetical protein NW752_010901 [Fusarium irregulare]